MLCFRFWLLQQHGRFIWTAGAAVILFRSELSILLGLILLMELIYKRLGILRVLYHTVPAGLFLLGERIATAECNGLGLMTDCPGLTIAVDSVFWKRWLWPEGEVLWYNTVLNKSHLWGVSLS